MVGGSASSSKAPSSHECTVQLPLAKPLPLHDVAVTEKKKRHKVSVEITHRNASKLTGDDGCVWMPARIPHAGPGLGSLGQEMGKGRVAARTTRLPTSRGLEHVDLAGHGAVEVVDVDGAVFAARVDVAGVGARRRREVAADERLEYAVPAEGDQRRVARVGLVVRRVVVHVAVVEAAAAQAGTHIVVVVLVRHLAEVPQLHRLVLAVAEHVAAVTFAVDRRDAFVVAEEDAGLAAVGHAAPVPDLDGRVVRSGVDNVWRGLVTITNGVNVAFVPIDSRDALTSFQVVRDDGVVRSPRQNLVTLIRETY